MRAELVAAVAEQPHVAGERRRVAGHQHDRARREGDDLLDHRLLGALPRRVEHDDVGAVEARVVEHPVDPPSPDLGPREVRQVGRGVLDGRAVALDGEDPPARAGALGQEGR